MLPEAHLEWAEDVGIFEVSYYLVMRKLLKNFREETQQSNGVKLKMETKEQIPF